MHISGPLAGLVGGTALVSALFVPPATAGAGTLGDTMGGQRQATGTVLAQTATSNDDLYDDADEAFKSMAQLVGTIAQRIADQPGRNDRDHDRSSGTRDPHAKGTNCHQHGGASKCDQPSNQDKSDSTSRSTSDQSTEEK
ncbi:hypothetical protein [Nocardia alni]|uniref:hypothetical protein n=1 Tax=Nocardia alni TaxID=2815723 RepID=UPI001C229CD6|nr:hypothetical protein [Nocardia alni]